MIVGLFGGSLVGKTTASFQLSQFLGWPVRSCGDEIRSRAAILQIPFDQLELEDHLHIDQETVRWANSNASCIVEGRFLDAVLPSVPDLMLIQLVASPTVRAERLQLRGKSGGIDAVQRFDIDDAHFRARMFVNATQREGWHTIDNTNLSVDECVAQIQQLVLDVMPHG